MFEMFLKLFECELFVCVLFLILHSRVDVPFCQNSTKGVPLKLSVIGLIEILCVESTSGIGYLVSYRSVLKRGESYRYRFEKKKRVLSNIPSQYSH